MLWTKKSEQHLARLVAVWILCSAAEAALAGRIISGGDDRHSDGRRSAARRSGGGDDSWSELNALAPDTSDHFLLSRMRRGASDARDGKAKAKKQEKKMIKIFKSTDMNSDGFVTKEEYLEKHVNSTQGEVRHIMRAYDLDSDGKISRSEFLHSVSPGARTVECDFVALQHCGMAFVEVVRRPAEQNNDVMCQAFQEYMFCLEEATSDCEPDDQFRHLIQQFLRLAYSFEEGGICPGPTVPAPALASAGAKDSATQPSSSPPSSHAAAKEILDKNKRRQSRYVIANTNGDEAPTGAEQCDLSPVIACDKEFMSAIRSTGDPSQLAASSSAATTESACNGLLNYRHCVFSKTRSCRDPLVTSLRDSVRYITKFYRRIGICQSKSSSSRL